MTDRETSPKVDSFMERAGPWGAAFERLRTILLDCGLSEDLKWGQPCYSLESGNVVLMHGFKDYCALLFFKGALIDDPESILVQQTENVQAARQIRFTAADEVDRMDNVIKAYVHQAIAIEKSGAKVAFKTAEQFAVAEEFQTRLDEDTSLKAAFEALTPGRRKAYLLHFSGAKQSKTRQARIDKCLPRILAGKGLLDD